MQELQASIRGKAIFGFALLSIGLVLLLSGCREREGLSNLHAVHLNSPEKRHPIQFTRKREALLDEIPSGGRGLSPEQKTDVFRFIASYKAESDGQLAISSPSGMRRHMSARAAIRDLQVVLRRSGIADNAVLTERHGYNSRYGRVLRLSYRRLIAVPPRCGAWPEDLGVDRERVHYNNFGCAMRRNLAITAHNGRDIIGPHPSGPRSSERRGEIWKDYVDGTNNRSEKSPAAPVGKTN